GYGLGVSLYIMTWPSKEAVMLSNFYDTEGHAYVCHRNTGPDNARKYHSERYPTEARSGKLRLVRRGANVSCQVAEGDRAFRELRQFELGLEFLSLVRVAADTSNSGDPVEVRIHDYEIRPLEVDQAVSSPTAAEEPP